MSRHVLITGATGALGRLVLPALRRGGMRIYALASSASEHIALPTAVPLDCDIADVEDLRETLEPVAVEAVVHLDRITKSLEHDPDETLRLNVLGAYNLLEWSTEAGVSRFVYASTSQVYGRPSRAQPFLIPCAVGSTSICVAERCCELAASPTMHVCCLRLGDLTEARVAHHADELCEHDAVQAILRAIDYTPRQPYEMFDITSSQSDANEVLGYRPGATDGDHVTMTSDQEVEVSL